MCVYKNICMYVCMHVCMYVCMYVCVYIYIHVYIYIYILFILYGHVYPKCSCGTLMPGTAVFFYMVLRNFRNDIVISDITEESPNIAA